MKTASILSNLSPMIRPKLYTLLSSKKFFGIESRASSQHKRANLVSGRNFEDFLEVAFGEHDDVIGIKYGVSKYLQAGQQGQQTLIADVKVANQFE